MLKRFLEQAMKDEPVYITDVREAFGREGTLPFDLAITLYDGSTRFFPMMLPVTHSREEKDFVCSYIKATVYNLLSSLGGEKMEIFTDTQDICLTDLARSLPEIFQSDIPKSGRSGYGKCMNVNDRVLTALFGDNRKFSFMIRDRKERPDHFKDPHVTGPEQEHCGESGIFSRLPVLAGDRMLLGIDVGGTDIKLAAAAGGKLVLCKEYDWFPAGFSLVSEMTDPIMLLARLMRCGSCLYASGKEEYVDRLSFTKDASAEQMMEGIRKMEAAAGEDLRGFDAIGLSFPDVVIRNRIVGGECHKFKGMRDNTKLDFEKQFAKVSGLNELLRAYVTPDGAVMSTNDGPMAAFTSAVELAAAHEDVSKGFFAHTLGTELGTGWVLPDGSIPELPLEVYNFIIDLGSFGQKKLPSSDVRSINNINTQLPGTLQKYTCQSGVFRLAAKYLPGEDPQVFEEALEKGLFIRTSDGGLEVPVSPRDMRKSALEFFMEKAAGGEHPVCERIFREIGEYLAVTWQETEYILHPEAKSRSLYGRLVKVPACFNQIRQGARSRVPGIEFFAADSSLANTVYMRQLDTHPDFTVAQFAQAVGAIYFGCLGLVSE